MAIGESAKGRRIVIKEDHKLRVLQMETWLVKTSYTYLGAGNTKLQGWRLPCASPLLSPTPIKTWVLESHAEVYSEYRILLMICLYRFHITWIIYWYDTFLKSATRKESDVKQSFIYLWIINKKHKYINQLYITDIFISNCNKDIY